eukprot:scaffold20778_cov69-Phaeocystis_antarctica.AAC.5
MTVPYSTPLCATRCRPVPILVSHKWHACGGVQSGTAITWSKPIHSPLGRRQLSNSAITAGRREISMSSFILDQVEGYSVMRAPARTAAVRQRQG